MKNKGFTLIELLAVIIILAIIALIAVPTILNIIENSKKKALENTAYGMIRAGEYYYNNKLFDKGNFSKQTFYGPNYVGLEFKGKKLGGRLTIDADGNIKLIICDGGYCATKGVDESLVTVEKSSETTAYSVGDTVYYNPVSGTSCDNYVAANSLNENKSGCMKWYVINDGGETIDALLDHNTTYQVAWISVSDYATANTDGTSCSFDACNDEGPITLLTQLQSDTSNWSDSLVRNDSYTDLAKGYTIDYSGYKARLIDANELWAITESTNGASGWTSATAKEEDKFYFDGNKLNEQVKSNYKWLFDYTNNCTNYGCDIADSGTDGYWTSSSTVYDPHYAWRVYYNGRVSDSRVYSTSYGLRPVITISKSSLSQ